MLLLIHVLNIYFSLCMFYFTSFKFFMFDIIVLQFTFFMILCCISFSRTLIQFLVRLFISCFFMFVLILILKYFSSMTLDYLCFFFKCMFCFILIEVFLNCFYCWRIFIFPCLLLFSWFYFWQYIIIFVFLFIWYTCLFLCACFSILTQFWCLFIAVWGILENRLFNIRCCIVITVYFFAVKI